MQEGVGKLVKTVRRHKVDLMLFGGSGLLAFLADFTTLQLVDKLSHRLLLATAAGIFVGFIVSYSLNQLRFSIRHERARKPANAFPLFFGLFLFNTGFTFVCLNYNDNHQFLPRIIVKMGTVGFIMVWNYILFHAFVFRESNSQRKTEEST